MNERILVVEDEPAIADALTYTLKGEGFDAEACSDGVSALGRALDGAFDLVVLDVLLPGLSGVEICRRIREQSPIPILMLTAKDAEVDRVIGLEAGADDYVTKPFSMPELLSRVRAILRRRELDRGAGASLLRVGSLELDLWRHEARVDGKTVALTPSEFKVLALLASEPGRVFNRRRIMQHLWDSHYVGDERACDIHISNARQKIESDPARPTRLLTVRGVGYKLAAVV